MDYENKLRTRRQFLLAGLGLSLSAIANCEEPYPNRPIKMIVPVPAGGGADNVRRHCCIDHDVWPPPARGCCPRCR